MPPTPSMLLSLPGPGPCQAARAVSTCDEVAEFRIEAHVIVCAVQPDHPELTGNIFRHRHVVHGGEEGGRLIVHIQH